MVIVISRESGCGGHEIGYRLAKKLGVAFYDKQIIAGIAREKGMNTNLPEFTDDVVDMDKGVLKDIVGSGTPDRKQIQELVDELTQEDCVIVGRLGMHLLKYGRDDVTSFYIHADDEIKLSRVMERYGLSAEKAKKGMAKIDKERKTYIEKELGKTWRSMSNFNFSIDSGYLGLNGSVDLMAYIVENRLVVSKCFD